MDNIKAKAGSIVRASPARVFDAIVNPGTMSKYWFTRHDAGLKAGEIVLWYIGRHDDAHAFEVHVKELIESKLIRVEWWGGEHFTEVTWRFQEAEGGHTHLTIEECGFKGTQDEIVASALDSTGGFNQVIIALKALLEHNVSINVVDDHA